jgi:hypothetical protein
MRSQEQRTQTTTTQRAIILLPPSNRRAGLIMRSTGSMRRCVRRPFVVTLFACLLSVLVQAPVHAVTIGISTDEGGTGCEFQVPPLMGTTRVYVMAFHNNSGISGAQFELAIPPCAPYRIATWSSPFVTIGDPESGIAFSTGGCLSGTSLLLTIDLQRVGEPIDECCALRLTPHVESMTGEVEIVDCSFSNVLRANSDVLWLAGDNASCALLPPPSEPSPVIGAIDVALATSLNCALHGFEYSSCLPLGSDWVQVFFGTDPNPPLVGNGGPFPYPVTGLAPATTYYWKVLYSYWGGGPVSSPVWSFTTTNSTPVTASTWGAIKALYR